MRIIALFVVALAEDSFTTTVGSNQGHADRCASCQFLGSVRAKDSFIHDNDVNKRHIYLIQKSSYMLTSGARPVQFPLSISKIGNLCSTYYDIQKEEPVYFSNW